MSLLIKKQTLAFVKFVNTFQEEFLVQSVPYSQITGLNKIILQQNVSPSEEAVFSAPLASVFTFTHMITYTQDVRVNLRLHFLSVIHVCFEPESLTALELTKQPPEPHGYFVISVSSMNKPLLLLTKKALSRWVHPDSLLLFFLDTVLHYGP